MDGKALSPAEVGKLADLESREVLLAKLAGAMKGTLTKAAVMFNQLPSQVARLAAALQEQKAAGAAARSPRRLAAAPAEAAAEPAAEAPAADGRRPHRSRPSRPDPTSTTRSDRRPAPTPVPQSRPARDQK